MTNDLRRTKGLPEAERDAGPQVEAFATGAERSARTRVGVGQNRGGERGLATDLHGKDAAPADVGHGIEGLALTDRGGIHREGRDEHRRARKKKGKRAHQAFSSRRARRAALWALRSSRCFALRSALWASSASRSSRAPSASFSRIEVISFLTAT